MYFQPLRIAPGWEVEWNSFMEIDPTPENINEFAGDALLYLRSSHRLRSIELCWRPEGDLQGSFQLIVINLLENFNKKNNTMEYDGDWANPYYTFYSKDRLEIVHEIERLTLSLDPYEDPRILVRRGEVDEFPEALRMELVTNGPNKELIDKILTEGNWKIQNLLIDHPDIDNVTLNLIARKGVRKGVKKKALQKLNSKRYRNRNDLQ
jgi:hypothetical protein